MEAAGRAAGLPTYSEVFADRAYLPNGRLVPRARADAMINGAKAATERLLRFVESGLMPVIGGDPIPLAAQSICVHGDGAEAVAMATEIRDRLRAAGVALAPFVR